MLFTPQKSYMGGCCKTMVVFFRGLLRGIGSNCIGFDLLSDTESRKRCFSFSSCRRCGCFPWLPWHFCRGLCEHDAQLGKELADLQGIDRTSLSYQVDLVNLVSLNNIFLLFNHLGKTIYTAYTVYTPYPSMCGVRHLQTSFNQHIMRWTSRSCLTNGFLDPWSQPSLHLYKQPITPGWLVWLCFWNWKALANTPKNSKETTHTTCIAHHPIHP